MLQITFFMVVNLHFSLATTDGRHRISEPSQLEDNGLYVAIGRERLWVNRVYNNFLESSSKIVVRLLLLLKVSLTWTNQKVMAFTHVTQFIWAMICIKKGRKLTSASCWQQVCPYWWHYLYAPYKVLILTGKFWLFSRFDRSVPYDDLGVVTQLTPRRWDH